MKGEDGGHGSRMGPLAMAQSVKAMVWPAGENERLRSSCQMDAAASLPCVFSVTLQPLLYTCSFW